MKRYSFLILSLAALICLTASAQSPDEKKKPNTKKNDAAAVIKRHIKAVGGQKRIESLQDVHIVGETQMGGKAVTVEQCHKLPHKYYASMSMGGREMTKVVFDGERGFSASPGQAGAVVTGQKLEGVKEAAAFSLYKLIEYSTDEYEKILEGTEQVAGQEAYQVVLTSPDQKKRTLFFSVKTGLLIREASEQGAVNYSDYRKVKGVKFAHKELQESPMGDLEMTMTYRVDEGIDDSKFEIE